VVSGGAWTRTTDADTSAKVTSGMFTFVEAGTTNADSGWVLTTDGTITLGTTALAFTQFSGAGQITAGAGLTKTGNTLDVVTASATRIVVNADSIDLATTGITAGTYISTTVDAYGRITAGTNPTTLSGYGIVDAQPLDATLTALAGVTTSANQLIYATGSDAFTTTSLTAFGRSILDDADATAGRTTLGLGTIATQNANNVAITGGTIDNIDLDGGVF
jgi:phage-related tail fiber protein